MVGRNLLEYFKQMGVETVPTDLSGWELNGNLLDQDFVFSKLASVDFDSIIHLAAMTEIKKTVENPKLCFEVNCLGTLNMLELAVRKKVSRFLYSSSANIFGAPRQNPVTEESPLAPRLPYDYSKVVSENLVMSYYKTKNLPVAITRSWLIFGPHDQPTRAIVRFINGCQKNEPLTLFNEGMDTTAPSYALNFSKLALTILRKDEAVGQAFNFGGERAVSVRELAELVKRLTGSSSELNLAPPRTEIEKEPQISYPSIAKIRTLLGFQHELSLEQGIARTIEWVKSGQK
jgi:UDP-glucuronate decarboxylase